MKLSTFVVLIFLISASIVFLISETDASHKVIAQQLPPPLRNQTPPLPNLSSNFTASTSNFTASIPLASSLFEALKQKISVSLTEVITNVTNLLGPNSTVISASLRPENGYLLYQVIALDDSNKFQKFLVDPANGTILLREQWPAILVPFPSVPTADSPTISVPGVAR